MNQLEVYILYQDQAFTMNVDAQKRIGSFLRRKREGLSPEDLGLPRPPRTRTPGLRRDDVAAMAGISTVWYSKIERGQAIGISREALQSISRVLRLQPPEHHYLMTLARQATVSDRPPPCLSIGPDTLRLLERINPLPAIVMNDYYDILAANQAYQLMCGIDLQLLAASERNYIGLVLSSPAWRCFLGLDGVGARTLKLARLAGSLRSISATRADDSRLTALILELRARSEEFARLWDSEVVTQPEATDYTLRHARLGPMVLRKQIWQSMGGGSTGRMSIFNPIDEADHQRLEAVYKAESCVAQVASCTG